LFEFLVLGKPKLMPILKAKKSFIVFGREKMPEISGNNLLHA